MKQLAEFQRHHGSGVDSLVVKVTAALLMNKLVL